MALPFYAVVELHHFCAELLQLWIECAVPLLQSLRMGARFVEVVGHALADLDKLLSVESVALVDEHTPSHLSDMCDQSVVDRVLGDSRPLEASEHYVRCLWGKVGVFKYWTGCIVRLNFKPSGVMVNGGMWLGSLLLLESVRR